MFSFNCLFINCLLLSILRKHLLCVRYEQENFFIQLICSLLKAKTSLTTFPFPCFIAPQFCWLLCHKFPVGCLSSIYCISIVLACYCAKPSTDAKRKRASANSCPQILGASLLRITQQLGQDRKISLAAATLVYGPVRMWHLTLSFKNASLLSASLRFHFAASGTQMLSQNRCKPQGNLFVLWYHPC